MKKWINKQTITVFLVTAFLFSAVTAFAAELNIMPSPFKFAVNGANTQVQAYLIDGYNYAKFADVVNQVNTAIGSDILSLKLDELTGTVNLNVVNTKEETINTPAEINMNEWTVLRDFAQSHEQEVTSSILSSITEYFNTSQQFENVEYTVPTEFGDLIIMQAFSRTYLKNSSLVSAGLLDQ